MLKATMQFNGQALQDKFVVNVLGNKRPGYFLEIGSHHPIRINNTYLLEKQLDWRGIMVEYDPSYLPLYKTHRPNSIHVIQDASQIDYAALFRTHDVPHDVDYLQIDLEVANGSTLRTLQNLDRQVMDTYRFATITFEHDIYTSNYLDTRRESREIFSRRGYAPVFTDISNKGNPYEDWYVHPDLVDMDYVARLQANNVQHYTQHPLTERALEFSRIDYT